MSFSPQQVVASAYLTSTAGALTSANVNKQRLTKLLVTEQAGTGGNVTFWLVPSGGSRGNDNRLIKTFNMLANETVDLCEHGLDGKIIAASATIHGQASSGTTDFTVVIDTTIFTDPS